ncbi:MAG: sigma-E processing peptidase SpoIIGA [Ruminococcaceae bacterium]|nr:sigma-E processing peptidase SpoIIGA [Oscillospiraceae bacterium]
MRIIYIDILLFLNFYITYFLIAGTCCFLHRHADLSRKILGSLAGALSSLAIFLPELPILLSLLQKLFFSSLIVLLSLGFGGIKSFLKSSLAFFIINCVYAGIMLALWLFSAPMGMVYNNGVSYFELPIWIIILSTAAAYLILRTVRYILDSKTELNQKYSVEIITDKGKAVLTAFPDSGNKLTDFFTGLPIIFCSTEKCLEICPASISDILTGESPESSNLSGIRVIPCFTVSGNTAAFCFKPKKIIIKNGETKKEVSALIGFTKSGLNSDEFDAVFNPNIL